MDCCSGTSAVVLRRLNERLGFQFILINAQRRRRELRARAGDDARMVGLQLAPLMQPLGADAGFLFDVDSDRVALAEERGRALSEEMVLPLVADLLLPRGPGKLVITNLSTTALVDEIAARHGGRVLRVPVGRAAAMDALATHRPEQVAVAGEGTGAVMMPRFRFVYDGIASMLAVLSLMRERGQSLSSIVDGYPSYTMLKGEVPLVVAAGAGAARGAARALHERRRAGEGERRGRPPRGLARPLVPRSRQPDRADRPRDLRAARRVARAALFDELMEEVRRRA